MFSLVMNENMKIYSRVRTWVLVGIIVLLAVLLAVVPQFFAKDKVDWKKQLPIQLAAMKEQLNDPKIDPFMKSGLENDIKLMEYAIEHQYYDYREDKFWSAVGFSSSLIVVVSVFTVVIASSSIAEEFATGTIKLLLIRPMSRFKVLISKYIAALGFALVLYITLILTSLIANSFFYGLDFSNQVVLSVNDAGNIIESSAIAKAFQAYGFTLVSLVIYMTLAYAISSIFKSSAMAISITLIMIFTGDLINLFLRKFTWVKYTLFSNLDLNAYFGGTPYVEGMTLQFSIIMLVTYFTLFHLFAYFIFTRRDVAA